MFAVTAFAVTLTGRGGKQMSKVDFAVACALTGMGWPRLVGSLKLHVSFAKYSLFYRALLQKRQF